MEVIPTGQIHSLTVSCTFTVFQQAAPTPPLRRNDIDRPFIEHLPAQMHLVLASRIDPFLPLARLRARSQLAALAPTWRPGLVDTSRRIWFNDLRWRSSTTISAIRILAPGVH